MSRRRGWRAKGHSLTRRVARRASPPCLRFQNRFTTPRQGVLPVFGTQPPERRVHSLHSAFGVPSTRLCEAIPVRMQVAFCILDGGSKVAITQRIYCRSGSLHQSRGPIGIGVAPADGSRADSVGKAHRPGAPPLDFDRGVTSARLVALDPQPERRGTQCARRACWPD